MRFIPAVSLVQIRLPLPFWPDGQAVKTPPFHGGNTGSIPVRVTTQRRCVYGRIAQLVRALASHARGQRFESVYAHQKSSPHKPCGLLFRVRRRIHGEGINGLRSRKPGTGHSSLLSFLFGSLGCFVRILRGVERFASPDVKG